MPFYIQGTFKAAEQLLNVLAELVQGESAGTQPSHHAITDLYVQKGNRSQDSVLGSDIWSIRIKDPRPCCEQLSTGNNFTGNPPFTQQLGDCRSLGLASTCLASDSRSECGATPRPTNSATTPDTTAGSGTGLPCGGQQPGL